MSRFSFPIASALKECFREGYSLATAKADLSAAVVVSLIALPLSMALSIAVGLPPQHGLYTAIAAGFVTALLGGSRTQVSGPTAAFVAILAPIVSQYGLDGLIWCQLMAGIFLLLMGWLKLGKYIEHVPFAVTTGFTSGIAVVIGTLSLNDFLGLGITKFGEHYLEKAGAIAANFPHLTPQEAAVGIITILIILGFKKASKAVPPQLPGVLIATGLAALCNHYGYAVETIETKFSYLNGAGEKIGGIPLYLPHFALPQVMDLVPLIVPALAVAALAALESLLSATVADNIAKTKHDPNAELTGIGFGNLFSGVFAGIPATGAIARTAANIQAGAKTPVASAIHAILLLVYMVAFAPYISKIPMAALAALLLLTAARMAHAHLFVSVLKSKDVRQVVVLLATFILTVLVDMVVGVGTGLALAFIIRKFFKPV
jgi:SulP family sulfate permease